MFSNFALENIKFPDANTSLYVRPFFDKWQTVSSPELGYAEIVWVDSEAAIFFFIHNNYLHLEVTSAGSGIRNLESNSKIFVCGRSCYGTVCSLTTVASREDWKVANRFMNVFLNINWIRFQQYDGLRVESAAERVVKPIVISLQPR